MSEKPLSTRLCLLAIFSLITLLSKAQLAPQFSATPVTGCAPLVVNFQDLTTGGAVQWKWDLGNSTISFLQNPSATYFNPGTYTIKLVVQNAAGTKDSITKTQYISVNASPTVTFSASPLTGCYPLPVQFADNSTPGSGSITGWLWDFGDGNSSGVQNPSHVYGAAGNYNVSLKVTNSNGCAKTLTRTNYITINTGVHAVFTNSTPLGCAAPETITFLNQSTGTGLLTYAWSFGDGGTSALPAPVHVYTTSGSFTVQLIVTNASGCKDTATHVSAINIGTVSADFTTPLTVCAGNSFSFTNTSIPLPLSALWSFGDGTFSIGLNPVKVYTTPGVYPVKLVSNFGGCKDSLTKNITVFPRPVADFAGGPIISCSAPHSVTFTNNSTGAISSQWLFGDGAASSAVNPSHVYTAPGMYTITLITTNANGCTDTMVKSNYVKIQLPEVTINNLPQQGCAPLSWAFTAAVTSNDPVTGYLWNFGDGTTSTLSNPSHVFAAGIYDIQLIITTASGCTDTVKVLQGIKATLKPVAAFTADPLETCAKIAVNFLDASTGTVTDWHWFFGDGSQSTEQNPSHVFQDTGYFTVTLIAGNNGCYDTLVLNNYIHIKPPIAIFTVDLDCANHFIKTFTDHSIGADQWLWNFGDGNTSTTPSPVHTYAATGTYIVTLTVVNNSTGCDFTKSTSITIADEHAAFTAGALEICRNTSAVFTATSDHNPPAIVSYDWDFGDGGTGTGITQSHIYSQAGLYTVRLIITDVNGCRDTLIRNQYIKVNGPSAGFISSVPGSCLLTSISFTDQSTPDGTHPITQWHWYYGDGIDETLTAPPFQHTYSAAGIYTVALVVTDTYGCTDSLSKSSLLTISTPKANFASADTVSCPGKPIVFSNTSTGPALLYQWNFGDGTTSTLPAPTHVYGADGFYSVQLQVTDLYGCTDLIIKPQYIRIASPVALFAVSDSIGTCPPLIVQFTNNSQNMNTYTWDFGDGNTSTAANPSHFYNVAGTYLSKLTITSPGGCTAVKSKTIEVKGPSGNFTYGNLTGCSPLTVTFTASTQSTASFVWDFNDGNTLLTNDSVVSHSYTVPGIYVPKMILKDLAGCTVAITGPDTIKVNGVLAAFSPDTLLRCNSGNVSFTNNSQSNDIVTAYLWDFGDGSSSADFEPVHFYATIGLYFPKLTVTTQTGCISSLVAQVPVKVVKTPDISFTQSANGCVPLTMNFNGNLINADTSAVTWQWNFSNGQQNSGQNLPAVLFPAAGIFDAQLIAINSSGCRDTAANSLEAYALPAVAAGSDISICQGSGQIILATGGVTYAWTPATGLSCANCASPIATPASQTDYIVTGTSLHGCTNSDVIRVGVNFPFSMQNSPGDTLCKGQSVVLTVSGAASYSWSPAAGLNQATGPAVTATPANTTTYRAVGFDGKNCFTDTAYFVVKVYPVPVISAGSDQTINVGQAITLTPTISADVTNVTWTPSTGIVSSASPAVTVKPSTDLHYKATAANAGGCTAFDEVTIHVLCNGANVFIPNTFSPNGDGTNDIFYPRGTGLFIIKQARIFNRWGEEVYARYGFNANDPTAGWDGSFKGQKVLSDAYVYMFEIQCENNTTMMYKGNISLIR